MGGSHPARRQIVNTAMRNPPDFLFLEARRVFLSQGTAWQKSSQLWRRYWPGVMPVTFWNWRRK